MASGSMYLGSDSDDLTVTKVSDRHLQFVRSRLIHHISESNDFSAEIHHVRGQPAQMVFSIGTQSAGRQPSVQMQTSNKILVKNLPPAYDEQHLQMFFEYDKGQIGQPVKKLTLNRSTHSAVIEFESSRAVDIVLSKIPITIMDKTVEVDVLTSYLEDGEKLGSVSVTVRGVTGIPEALGEELIRLDLDDQNVVYKQSLNIGDRVKVLKIPSGTSIFLLAMSGIKIGTIGTISSFESDMAVVTFRNNVDLAFALSDIELVM